MRFKLATRVLTATVALGALAVTATPAAAKPSAVVNVSITSSGLGFTPVVSGYESLVVTVTGPGSIVLRKEFGGGQAAVIAAGEGGPWPNGQYRYEVRVVPHVDAGTRDALAAARETDGGVAGATGVEPLVQSGGFQVQGGAIVPATGAFEGEGMTPLLVVPEDLIVQGSGCFGFDCVDGESFGFDTIRLKENNLRIGFMDTSVGAFPANDWEITVNDSASGGANRFSITDITASRTPFTVEAGAATNSILVDSIGRVGFRTATPVLDLHVNTTNTPGLRLEQNNGGGFTAQTWDVAGNEANFFVRDATNGSLLPFRIRPGAITSSLDIHSNGNVGIGKASAAAPLHVQRSDGSTQILIQNVDGPIMARRLIDMQNNGGVRMRLQDNSTNTVWAYQNIDTNFYIDANAGANEFMLTTAGNLTISGILSQGSDRNQKTAIRPVDPEDVLRRVVELPITTWAYKEEKDPARHVGPMAQDFAASFGLGGDEKRLAPGDVAGVALAAIQALYHRLEQRDAELVALRALFVEQATRVRALEAALGNVRVQEVHKVLDGDRLVENGDAHP